MPRKRACMSAAEQAAWNAFAGVSTALSDRKKRAMWGIARAQALPAEQPLSAKQLRTGCEAELPRAVFVEHELPAEDGGTTVVLCADLRKLLVHVAQTPFWAGAFEHCVGADSNPVPR